MQNTIHGATTEEEKRVTPSPPSLTVFPPHSSVFSLLRRQSCSNNSGNCGNSIIIISNSRTEVINEATRLHKQKNEGDADEGEVSGNNNRGEDVWMGVGGRTS